jgi:transposase
MSEGGKVAVQADDQVVSASENRALKKRVRELGRLLGNPERRTPLLFAKKASADQIKLARRHSRS